MKIIYISIPITGHEDTYEQRLDEAVEYVGEKYPEYDRIITPKYLAEELNERLDPIIPTYSKYLSNDIDFLTICDAIFMCSDWCYSCGCNAEWAFARAIGLTILYQDEKEE